MSDLKHTKVTEYSQEPDGVTKIHAKSYYEELAHEKVEYEKKLLTEHDTILKDFLGCLDLVTRQESPEVVITVKKDTRSGGWTITKRWTIEKRSFNHH